jgi:ABC-2 type transport system permease protein
VPESVRRHLKILFIYYRASLMAQMEYRANFGASFVLSLLWPCWIVSLLSVFFYHTSTLGGWSFYEAMMVLGMYDIFIGLQETILAPNLQQVTEHIQKGTLDFVLLKPANGQFLATLTSCNLTRLFDVAIGFGLVFFGLYSLGRVPSLLEIAAFAVMLPAGMVIVYSVWLLTTSMAFWFVRIDNFGELFYAFYETGRFPVTVYRPWLRLILTYVVPIAFLTTFPAATLLGKISPSIVAGSAAVAAVLFYASHRFWNYAIRFYSSASS